MFEAKIKNKILKTFGAKPANITVELKKMEKLRSRIMPFVKDTFEMINDAAAKKKKILFEGADGIMLDSTGRPTLLQQAQRTA